MPLLLYIYLATEILAPFAAALLILNGILFLVKLLPLLEGIFAFGIGGADFLRLWIYLSPQLLLFSIPMASMMGVIIAFTRMNNENEIIALKASGISLYRLLPPVILVALFTAGLTALSSTYFIPHGTQASKLLLFQLAKERIDQGMRERQFSESLKDVVLYADRIDRDTGRWHGVYISDLRDARTPMTVIARLGRLQAHVEEMRISLELENGSMHRAVDEVTQTVLFDRYQLNLPVETPEYTAGVDKKTMTGSQLRERAEKLGTDTPEGAGLLIEYHTRLVLPVACFLLTLFGLPLALSSRPGLRPRGLPIALGIFILYYVTFTAAKSLSESPALPVGLLMWLPNLVFGTAALLLLRNAARERHGRILKASRRLITRIYGWRPSSKGRSR